MPTIDPASGHAPRRRGGERPGRTLLGAVLGLAMLGAATLMLADDTRWLRLGIVAALWAALVGSFTAARYRREMATGRERGEELRKAYQLELQREVVARRESELKVDAGIRRRVEREVRNEVTGELEGLRAELSTLRQNMEAMFGGKVLVDRMARPAELARPRPDQLSAGGPRRYPGYPGYPASAGPGGAQQPVPQWVPRYGPQGDAPLGSGNPGNPNCNPNGDGSTGRIYGGEDGVTRLVDDLLTGYTSNGVHGPAQWRHRRDGG